MILQIISYRYIFIQFLILKKKKSRGTVINHHHIFSVRKKKKKKVIFYASLGKSLSFYRIAISVYNLKIIAVWLCREVTA